MAIAEKLASQGFDVIVHGRSSGRLGSARAHITERAPGASLRAEQADLASLGQVRSLADRLEAGPRLDLVISSAATISPLDERTADGFRRTVAVNHLAPYLLLRRLAGHMTGAGSRVVIVGADPGYLAARPVDVDDLDAVPAAGPGLPAAVVPFALYGVTKNMNVMFMYALARRLRPTGVTVNGAHPGVLSGTGLSREVPETSAAVARLYRLPEDRPDAAQGADTPVWVSTDPGLHDVTGRFFVNRESVETAGHTTDPERCDRLWAVSAKAVGLQP